MSKGPRSRRGQVRAKQAAADSRRSESMTMLLRTKTRARIGLTMTVPGYFDGRPFKKVSPPFDRTTIPLIVRGLTEPKEEDQ